MSPPLEKSKGSDAKGHRLPEDWTAPAVGQLPKALRSLLSMWPAGAYAAVAEQFVQHWRAASGRTACKRDWNAAFAKWCHSEHAQIMRAAKAGVSFIGDSGRDAVPAPIIVNTERPGECGRARAIRDAVLRAVGPAQYQQWFDPVRLAVDGGVVTVAGTAFRIDQARTGLDVVLRSACQRVLGEQWEDLRWHIERAG